MDPILTREARNAGLTVRKVRGPRWSRPAAGVAVPAGTATDLRTRCRAVLRVLPADAVITHLTSAALRGWWLPQLAEIPVIACTDGDAPHLDRRGVYVRRCGIPPHHRTEWRGISIASSAWTIVELAEHLSLIDLVVAIDGALHLGDVTMHELRCAVVPRRHGVRALRRALELCDGRSESPWETVLRLLHVLCGIEVESQALIVGDSGDFIARADLHIRGTRRIAEYDGAGHRERDQHQRDLRRDKRLARAGYERFGYVAAEILREPGRIIRDADDARGIRHDPRRVRPWLRAVAESAMMPDGRSALTQRLARFDRVGPPRASSGAKRTKSA